MPLILTARVKSHRPHQIWVFRKPDTNWTILKTDQGICKGVIEFEPKDGDLLQLEGSWGISEFSGEKEFSFKTATIEIPTDPRALLTYARSITKGIGEATEAEIWMEYGESWRDHPDLDGIIGCSEMTRFAWKETLNRLVDQDYMTKTIAYLLAHGCTLNLAQLAWNIWADDALGKVQANCYCLADLPHYGFSQVDTLVREHFGIGDQDPRRLDACVMYHMKQQLGTGNTLVLMKELVDPVMGYIGCGGKLMKESIVRLVDNNQLIYLDDALGVDSYLALPQNYEDECAIWRWSNGI